MRYLLILCLLMSGCCSWAKIHRDEQGRVCKIVYSGGQSFSINKDGVSGNNKLELIDLDISAVKAGL